ncbi:MAG: HAD family phosphatase [Patescibacteria group bacterium]|nr:HAD family phosphatase [Patescibacteria group bacterium]
MIKAIIYDMDDLMVNSHPLHALATERLLESFNRRFMDLPENLRSKFVGMRVIDICKEIIKEFKLSIDLEAFYKQRSQLFMDLVKDELKILPGLTTSLKLFKNNDYRIALASSAVQEYINLVLDKFNLRNYFDVIVSGDSIKFGKPNPETYSLASKKLGCQPAECLVLEDAENGIISAKGAGCRCIAIINLNTPPQDRSQADIILPSLVEITLEMVKAL